MSNRKPIHFLVNPSAGTEEPVLDIIAATFASTGRRYDICVCNQAGDVQKNTDALKLTGDIIAVYGGDGTIMEAAGALVDAPASLFIIPGGTANVMAKELGMPVDTKKALTLLKDGHIEEKKFDTGTVNGCPFFLRVNLGILADMVTETSEDMKETWGQWAYGFTAFQQFSQASRLYEMNVDGRLLKEEAVALTITNAGNIGVKGLSFLPGIRMDDGLLDLVVLTAIQTKTLLQMAGAMLLQKDTDALLHIRGKELVIRSNGMMTFLRDDAADEAGELHIQTIPASLRIMIPDKA